MPVPDPRSLLAVARDLATPDGDRAPTGDRLRRAVSTVYYAVFHTVARAGTDLFVGADQSETARYAMVYRSFDHRHIGTMCAALDVSTFATRLRQNLRRDRVCPDMRLFATSLTGLQAERHKADYDPSADFTSSDVFMLIDSAELAIAAFDRVPPDEKADILALLMVRVRD